MSHFLACRVNLKVFAWHAALVLKCDCSMTFLAPPSRLDESHERTSLLLAAAIIQGWEPLADLQVGDCPPHSRCSAFDRFQSFAREAKELGTLGRIGASVNGTNNLWT